MSDVEDGDVQPDESNHGVNDRKSANLFRRPPTRLVNLLATTTVGLVISLVRVHHRNIVASCRRSDPRASKCLRRRPVTATTVAPLPGSVRVQP
jgi:hypothetical protein